MALTVKVALLVCLTFTGGFCWLVSQVAQPVVELSPPVVVQAPQGSSVSSVDPPAREDPAKRLRSASPVDPEQRQPVAAMPLAAVPEPEDDVEPELPPLHDPGPPVAERENEPEHGETPGAAEPRTGAGIAIARIVESGPSMLAARRNPSSDAPGAGEASPQDPEHAAGETPGYTNYIVKPGDSLVGIARRTWGSDDPVLIDRLLAENPQLQSRKDTIYVDEEVRIPHVDPGPELVQAAPPQLASAIRPGSHRSYTVQANDTLARIARTQLNDESRWPEIQKLNRMRNPDRIQPGMRIKLPAPGD